MLIIDPLILSLSWCEKLGNLTSALLYLAGSIEPHRREGMMPGSIENVMISSPFVSKRSAIAAIETA